MPADFSKEHEANAMPAADNSHTVKLRWESEIRFPQSHKKGLDNL